MANLSGFVQSVEWEQPVLTKSPSISCLNYDKEQTKWFNFKHSSQKIYCDLNRICEIEDSATEWYDAQYYSQNPHFELGFL